MSVALAANAEYQRTFAFSLVLALLLLISCVAATSACAQTTAVDEENFQQWFEEGVQQLVLGQYANAVTTFEALYEQTGSDRVKLEWARALYLAGEHERAIVLFREVLANDPPLAVVDRVETLIRDMELQRGQLNLTVGLATDTNPRAISSAEGFNLFGFDFLFDPGVDRGTQIGVAYGASLAKSFGDQNRFIASLAISGNEFEGSDFDNFTISASGLYFASLTPRLYLRPGFELGYFANRPLYHFPYITLGATSETIIPDMTLGLELTTGQITYSDFDFLNAVHFAGLLRANRYVNENWRLEVAFLLAHNEANTPAYTSNAFGVQASSSFALHTLSLLIEPQLGYTLRRYKDRDPFFGIVRNDKRLTGRLAFHLKGINIRNFAPVLELSWEHNTSNIALYSYTRGIWGISFRRAY